ncbi:hypothetical protein ACFQ9Q_28710 [Streptomyces virginiae]|uniref:hypothetical protein n=1 Tax=Streptomyces virginiae TaxID=1961 RepID=UPI0036A5793C
MPLKEPPGRFVHLTVWFFFVVLLPYLRFMLEVDGKGWQRVVGTTAFLTAAILLLLGSARALLISVLTPVAGRSRVMEAVAGVAFVLTLVAVAGATFLFGRLASLEAERSVTMPNGIVEGVLVVFGCSIVCGTVGAVSGVPTKNQRRKQLKSSG